MCVTQVGIDTVSISQTAAMLASAGQTYRDTCWTPAEQTYCGDSTARYAMRWAAKEAAMKALGHGIGEVDPLDVEVVAVTGQRPHLKLSAAAYAHAQIAGVTLALSMTQDADIATAVVVATRCCTTSASQHQLGAGTTPQHENIGRG